MSLEIPNCQSSILAIVRLIARQSCATAWRRDQLRISPRSQRFGLMSPLGDHDLEVFARQIMVPSPALFMRTIRACRSS